MWIHVELEGISKFTNLFEAINELELGQEYRNAYDESVKIAKGLVDMKRKFSWDANVFQVAISVKYPNLEEGFISVLRRCVENYNPQVNLPDEPLW